MPTVPVATRSWYRSLSLKKPELKQTRNWKLVKKNHGRRHDLVRRTRGEDPEWGWGRTHWGRRGVAAGSWPRGCRLQAALDALQCVCPRWKYGHSLNRSWQSFCPRNMIPLSGISKNIRHLCTVTWTGSGERVFDFLTSKEKSKREGSNYRTKILKKSLCADWTNKGSTCRNFLCRKTLGCPLFVFL